jgi:probable HAF family extracellular repeat protein
MSISPPRVFMIVAIVLCGASSPAQADSFSLDPYTFARIDVPDASGTFALGINNAGQIVGTYTDDTGNHAFLASGDQFTTIDATVAYGINNLGQIVGSTIGTDGLFHGFLDSGSNVASIDVPGASFTQALGISDTGAIVGYFNSFEIDGLGNRGFLSSGGSFTTIEVPGSPLTLAAGINTQGQIVGSYSDADGAARGYLYEGNSFTRIDVPGASATVVNGINNLGQIVGWYSDATGPHAFLLSGGSFATIDMPGVSNLFANGINDRGEIVGYYSDAEGQHGFVASPVPEPSSLALFLVGLAGFTTWRNRKAAGNRVRSTCRPG